MSLRSYLLTMSAMTVVCWAAFAFVLNTVDPATTNAMGFLLFYAALFFSLSGSAAIIGFIVRFIFLRHELVGAAVITAFRQSFLFAGFIVAVLIMLKRDLLSWFNLLVLIVGLSALEFFLLSYGKSKIKPDENDVNI